MPTVRRATVNRSARRNRPPPTATTATECAKRRGRSGIAGKIPAVNERAMRFPLFDSLRAIAALAVLATHAAVFASLETGTGTTLGQYAARLDVGVAVFFVISGCLLYHPFARARLL